MCQVWSKASKNHILQGGQIQLVPPPFTLHGFAFNPVVISGLRENSENSEKLVIETF